MKKSTIYMILAAVLVLFASLTVVYRTAHPDRLVPAQEYTELKARRLTGNYIPAAEELDIDASRRGSSFYAVMIEYPTRELEKSEGVTARFIFLDVMNKCVCAKSSGASESSERLSGSIAYDTVQTASGYFGDGFAEATDQDYGIPDYGTVKLYLRRGDGVYFRSYPEAEFPSDIFGGHGSLAEFSSYIEELMSSEKEQDK